ncbi:MAG: hypothetical protein NTW21_20750 [Verrucomicrobia bacterium]|nr:hypothetical protein [Verrucomicrobiota bacterium]
MLRAPWAVRSDDFGVASPPTIGHNGCGKPVSNRPGLPHPTKATNQPAAPSGGGP